MYARRHLPVIFMTLASIGCVSSAAQARFAHPGLIYDRAELNLIRSRALSGQEPWKSDYALFNPDPNYIASPVATEKVGQGQFQIRGDAGVARDLAIKWYITNDQRYADGAIRIIDAWANTLKDFNPTDNLSASAAIQGFGEAAEILIHTGHSKWTRAEVAQYKDMMLNRLYPAVSKARTDQMEGNQGIDAVMAAMAVGIALDIHAYFDESVQAWTQHPCLAITNFILPDGQMAEAGRDQPHAFGELAAAEKWARLASHQGVDLYSTADNRLLAGFEYWTTYNFGYDVPFTKINRCNYGYGHISSSERGRVGAVDFQRIYSHYVTEQGLQAPFVTLALARTGSGLPTELTDHEAPIPVEDRPLENGTYSIISRSNFLAISTPGDKSSNDTPVDMEAYSGRPSQKWRFTRISGNIYSIINTQNGAIETAGNELRLGTPLQIHSFHQGLSQSWHVVKTPDGSFAFFNASTNGGMTIVPGSAEPGAHLVKGFVATTPNPSDGSGWTLQTEAN